MDPQQSGVSAEATRVLIVANKTALGKPLLDAVEAILAKGPASFVVLVPATEPEGNLTWDETAAWRDAEARAIEVVTALSEMGAEASGMVGDRSPVDAVQDLLEATSPPFQEIIVSTLPLGISRWLGLDLPNQVRRMSGVPVTHVVFDPRHPTPAPEPETHPDWDRPVNRMT